jgi:wyosine [tRNA(Phe)-imidazoG37] synthetase (radical SAM superfamily)
MNKKHKAISEPVAKRNLMTELTEGMAAISEARNGKRTLRTHVIEDDTTDHVEEPRPSS